jgi:hypothetical protein
MRVSHLQSLDGADTARSLRGNAGEAVSERDRAFNVSAPWLLTLKAYARARSAREDTESATRRTRHFRFGVSLSRLSLLSDLPDLRVALQAYTATTPRAGGRRRAPRGKQPAERRQELCEVAINACFLPRAYVVDESLLGHLLDVSTVNGDGKMPIKGVSMIKKGGLEEARLRVLCVLRGGIVN